MSPAPPTDSPPRPAMLVLTHLDVWELTAKHGVKGAGNQDMYNTLLGYADAGYDVRVLTTSVNLPGVNRIADHIHVHRVGLPGLATLRRLRTMLGSPAARGPDAPTSGGNRLVRQSLKLWASFQCAAIFHALRLSRHRRFELVYGYEIHGALAGYILGRLWRVPCVTRFQGTELSPLIATPGVLWRRFWTWIIGYTVPADLVVMANDGTEGDRLLRYLRVRPQRIGFWMNGVDKGRVLRPNLDVAAFRRDLGIPADHTFVLTTVRLIGWKRYDRALTALSKVFPRTRAFTYVIVGDGPLRDQLEAQARDLGLGDHVKFTGALPHERVVEFVNACDIYLSVNDLSNLGNPLIEATLCGRCVVTLNNGATRDLITHDVNGLMLPPDDNDALADALARLIQNPAERARLAAGARERAKSLLTWAQRMELETETLHRITRGRTLRGSGTNQVT